MTFISGFGDIQAQHIALSGYRFQVSINVNMWMPSSVEVDDFKFVLICLYFPILFKGINSLDLLNYSVVMIVGSTGGGDYLGDVFTKGRQGGSGSSEIGSTRSSRPRGWG